MKDGILIFHATDAESALTRVANKPYAWLYLGYDIAQREKVSQVLGKENRFFVGALLRDAAHQQKQPCLDFIAELGLRQKNKRRWWASNIAYKSPLASDFFLLWCYTTVFDRVCSEKNWGGENRLFVFVEDRWLYRYLWQSHRRNGDSLSFLSRKSVIPEILKLISRGIAYRGYFLSMALLHRWQTRHIGGKSEVPNLADQTEVIYIYTWIRDRFFKENGRFESPFFGRLPQIMSNNNLNVVFIAPLFLPAPLRSKCLNQHEFRFIFLDQYVSLWSIVQSCLSIFSIASLSNTPQKILLLREIAREFSFFPINILEYFVFKSYLEEIGQKKTTIIYPFENQPWDKMLCLAANERDENTRLIGYQHSIVPPMLLNYFLGAGESSSMPLPQLIVTNGEHTLNLLKNAGYGETRIVNGGALRYEYVHKIDTALTRKHGTSATVLVAMPYSRSLTRELLICLFNAFMDLEGEGARFIIRFHPEVPPERLGIQLPTWPAHFQRTDRPLLEILEGIDLVVYSSSTVGLEALQNGIPVVRYCSEHSIDLDPLDAFGEESLRSCSEANFRQVVLQALAEGSNHQAQRSALSKGNLDDFFSSVDEDMWAQIVRN